ncbi:MAG TPA: LeuA family protein [Vicinamibacteria bacterium]|nr:LeuA family protein [Vicinamibacteria bacterium]
MEPRESELVYDWNRVGEVDSSTRKPIEFDDETLRDGLQSPSVTSPPIEKKIEILHMMEALGIHAVDIGLPGAGPHVKKQVLRLAREIAEHGMKISANCAARTLRADIEPIVEVSQQAGIPIEAATFIGSSPIRQYAEGWELDRLLRHTEEAVRYTVDNGLPNMYVTEDTTRARPETIRKLYTTAIECGARRVVVTDTVGHATPSGARALVGFMKEVVADTGEDVKIDWHGHRDRGLSIPNSLAAIEAGVDRVHACALGIGERCGNTPMDILLVNLKLEGRIDNDLSRLAEYCRLVSEAVGMPIPTNYPVVGEDAFRTGTGVHAAAVIKALNKKDKWLADRVYSGVPAGEFGLSQEIEVGPMSGLSNVHFWLSSRGLPLDDDLVKAVFEKAKSSNRVLEDEEIEALARQYSRSG